MVERPEKNLFSLIFLSLVAGVITGAPIAIMIGFNNGLSQGLAHGMCFGGFTFFVSLIFCLKNENTRN